MERSAQKMPRLPELQEMDDKQLNESLSQFYTEAPSKVVANFVFFLNLLPKLLRKEFHGHFADL